jgi:uncharacterized protein YmfQ (DUF2313 family)
MIPLFKRHPKDEHADSLADYLPNDDLFAAKKISGKKFRQLLLGLAKSLQRTEDKLETAWEEIDPATTTSFIDDWESALGIPDDCFLGNGPIEERRLHVIVKLGASVQTAEDFEDLAAELGLSIKVTSGISHSVFPFTFPILFFDSPKEARFTMVVNVLDKLTGSFPYTFPITFGNPTLELVKCLFNKLKPANTQIIFRQV